jgi:hypothetical protein
MRVQRDVDIALLGNLGQHNSVFLLCKLYLVSSEAAVFALVLGAGRILSFPHIAILSVFRLNLLDHSGHTSNCSSFERRNRMRARSQHELGWTLQLKLSPKPSCDSGLIQNRALGNVSEWHRS